MTRFPRPEPDPVRLALLALALGTAHASDVRTQQDALASAEAARTPSASDAEVQEQLTKGVSGHIAVALAHNPAVQAAFARWKATVHRAAQANQLPEPTLTIGAFARSVETRVGPQQARLGVQQALPWPTTLSAGQDAATAAAEAAHAQLDATALAVSRAVSDAYWTLWQLRDARRLHRDHLDVLTGLSATVGGRVKTGSAGFAGLQQVDLSHARLEDQIASMDQQEQALAARLRAVLGVQTTAPIPTDVAPPPLWVPAEDRAALASAALAHPMLTMGTARIHSAEATARVAAARRMPAFTVGADWILTGPSPMPDVEDSGKDAISVGLGVKVPLWQRAYGQGIAAAEAEASALRSDQQTLEDQRVALLDGAIAAVLDSERRARVTETTLLPQAQAAYTSLLGAWATGDNAVAQAILAQRDLLDLQVRLTNARADHARAWAILDDLCGRPVVRTPAPEVLP